MTERRTIVFNPVLSPGSRLVADTWRDAVRFNPVLSPRSRVEPRAEIIDASPADVDGSLWSRDSVTSIVSLGSAGSILSIGSAGSVLSLGSAGSILSIGSAGSVLSIGSVGSVASIGSAFSIGALGGWGERRAAIIEVAAGLVAIAALATATLRR